MRLSYSKINTLLQCPRKFELEYIERVESLANPNQYLGGTMHQAMGTAYGEKRDGNRLSPDDVGGIFSEYWDRGAFLEDEELQREVDWRREDPADVREAGILLAKKYWRDIAPHIDPVDVEVPLERGIDRDITLQVRLDLVTADGAICDLKTAKRAYSDREVDRHIQPTLCLLASGKPGAFHFHFLVKANSPYTMIKGTERTQRGLQWTANVQLPRIAEMIKAGIFPPNTLGFLCSPEHCEVWEYCRRGFQEGEAIYGNSL